MERTTDEMAATLSKLLGIMEKTASKHEDEAKDHDKAEDHGKDHEEKAEDDAKDKDDKAKDHKKASVVANVVNTLVKLADDLDAAGDSEASDLVDNALSIIMQNIDGNVEKSAGMMDVDLGEYAPEMSKQISEMHRYDEDLEEDLEHLNQMEELLHSKLKGMSPEERKAFKRWLETGHKD